jgi:hypothetical protein
MMEALLRLSGVNQTISTAIVRAVEPDDRKMDGLAISSRVDRGSVTFKLVYAGRIETFISTLDDLLRCVHAAKETLDHIAHKESK